MYFTVSRVWLFTPQKRCAKCVCLVSDDASDTGGTCQCGEKLSVLVTCQCVSDMTCSAATNIDTPPPSLASVSNLVHTTVSLSNADNAMHVGRYVLGAESEVDVWHFTSADNVTMRTSISAATCIPLTEEVTVTRHSECTHYSTSHLTSMLYTCTICY